MRKTGSVPIFYVTPELYGQIRNEWKTHSMAEDRRDIAGLLSTLTADCVYEIVQTEHVWRGHDGAKRFYTELLTAFPDIKFDLTSHRRAMGSLTFRWCRQRTTYGRPRLADGYSSTSKAS